MPFAEYNFDGLVGPTHNYAGLGSGNLASMGSKHNVSHPRAAALEGLAKMKLLAEMGIPQAVLPPQRRPHVGYLRGKYGRESGEKPTADEVRRLLTAAAENGEEGRRDLAIASSASSMWAANAATVSPSRDTADVRCHFTIANLISQPHRSLEAAERHRVFAHLFGDDKHFAVHAPLASELPDEGAANHTRLCSDHGRPGIEVFTWGFSAANPVPYKRFKPRQSVEASDRIIIQHRPTPPAQFRKVPQHDAAIYCGAFHNDVVSVGNGNVLLIHEFAWTEPAIRIWFERHLSPFFWLEIKDSELPLFGNPIGDAVKSYLFNSQLVTLPSGGMALIYPAECDEVPTAKSAIERILREDNPIEQAVRVDVRQSMKNGGGPACLRLRVVLSDEEKAAVRGNVFWTPQLHETLVGWVNRHYRESLTPADLADVRLWQESEAALDELAQILDLPI